MQESRKKRRKLMIIYTNRFKKAFFLNITLFRIDLCHVLGNNLTHRDTDISLNRFSKKLNIIS